MHSSDHSQTATTTADSTLNNTTESERLKHRSNSQSNGIVTSKNGHEKSTISTQTINSTLNNGNNHTNRLFTHSQREILRLVGQHLQSVGLKYEKKNPHFSLRFVFLF